MTDYTLLSKQIAGFAQANGSFIPLFSNASALLWDAMPQLNWCGFYYMNKGALVLGPFQGKVACIGIPVGKGVCGTAVQKDSTLRVSDVHEFPGHIACDSASESEIVVPIHVNGKVCAVLDIDSPIKNRFTQEDQQGLEMVVKALEEGLSSESLEYYY